MTKPINVDYEHEALRYGWIQRLKDLLTLPFAVLGFIFVWLYEKITGGD